MRNLIGQRDNLALCTCRQQTSFDFQHVLVSDSITERCYVSLQTGEVSYVFPLYLYPEEGSIDTERRPNLDEKIWAQINTAIGKEASPEDIFDYIYGVLHSPAYRAKYKEFLKVDFPRIPYPKDLSEFEHFRSFGNQLRELHLMHSVPDLHVTFPESGSMLVEKAEFVSSVAPEWDSGIGSADSPSISPESDSGIGIVRINATQYFANVPREAWDFYIGGYQPAQKWLKDRKGHTLSFDDIEHYRKIIAVLMETKAIMEQIG
jgi:predicted helicase